MPLKAQIAPSLLSGDFAILASECNRMLDLGADILHMDVMDGHFVDNLTFGAPIIKSLRKHTKGFLDCHLMVTNPEKWVDDFVEAGADNFTFHIETTDKPEELVRKLNKTKCGASLCLKPKTPVSAIKSLLDNKELKFHHVLVMTVEPGFGGQKFMEDMMPKVRELRTNYPDLNIQVDGGLDKDTVVKAAEAGANIIVAGSSIFKAEDPKEYIAALRESVNKSLNK